MPLVKKKTSFTKTISRADLDAFVLLTGDDNLIHTDIGHPSVQAMRSRLGVEREIAHGPLILALVCRPIMELGGSGTVLKQIGPVSFRKPVQIGDEITVRCIADPMMYPKHYNVTILIKNQRGESVTDPAYAVIYLL